MNTRSNLEKTKINLTRLLKIKNQMNSMNPTNKAPAKLSVKAPVKPIS